MEGLLELIVLLLLLAGPLALGYFVGHLYPIEVLRRPAPASEGRAAQVAAQPGFEYCRVLLEALERMLADAEASAIGYRASLAAGRDADDYDAQARRCDLEAAHLRAELVRRGLWTDEQAEKEVGLP